MSVIKIGRVRPYFRGNWDTTIKYDFFDLVTYKSQLWLMVSNNSISGEKPDEQKRWILFGAKGPKGAQGIEGKQGPRGEKGETGCKGIEGAEGAQGPTGPSPNHSWEGQNLRFQNPDGSWGQAVNLQGPQGEQGPQGIEGRQGPRGIKGETGSEGAEGVQGPTGPSPSHSWKGQNLRFQNPDGSWGQAVNLQGPQGEQGPQGIEGKQGPHGAKGETGSEGAEGVQGPTGPSPNHSWEGQNLRFQNPDGSWGQAVNLQGPQGKQGPQGNQGPQGKIGPKGLEGKQGVQGPTGPVGSPPAHSWSGSSIRFKSPNGSWGAYVNIKGDKGDQGIKGPQGPVGATGSKGDRGAKGDKGDKGDPGIPRKLTDSVALSSSIIAASATAVKTAYNKAVSAYNAAKSIDVAYVKTLTNTVSAEVNPVSFVPVIPVLSFSTNGSNKIPVEISLSIDVRHVNPQMMPGEIQLYLDGDPNRAFKHGIFKAGDTAFNSTDKWVHFEYSKIHLLSSGTHSLQLSFAALNHPFMVEAKNGLLRVIPYRSN